MATKEHVGVFTYIDENGDKQLLYPVTKTDETLSEEGSPADAAAVGAKLKEVIDAGTIKYNEESDYIQLLKEGEWKDWKLSGLTKQYLYEAHLNHAEFTAYDGCTKDYHATPSFTESIHYAGFIPSAYCMYIQRDSTKASNKSLSYYGCVISKAIDLTNYSKLVFSHISSCSNESPYYLGDDDMCAVFITDFKQPKMIPLAYLVYHKKSERTPETTVELDISNISGECFIGFEIGTNSQNIITMIRDVYLEE